MLANSQLVGTTIAVHFQFSGAASLLTMQLSVLEGDGGRLRDAIMKPLALVARLQVGPPHTPPPPPSPKPRLAGNQECF